MSKSLLDRIDVKTPCSESWDEMTGNDQVRLCSHCAKDVHDLSSMTRLRAEKIIRDSGGGICVRYIKDDRGQMINTPPRFTQIKRQASIAAGVLAASLTLSTATFAQGSSTAKGETINIGPQIAQKKNLTSDQYSITGTVTDQYGAVVPGAKVTLTFVNSGSKRFTTTNVEGIFEFSNVELGEYEIEIISPGFKKLISKIDVSSNYKFKDDLVLEVNAGEVVGELIINDIAICDEPAPISDKIEGQKLTSLPVSGRTFTTMGMTPGIAEKPKDDKKKPAKKNKNKLPN